MLKNIEEQSVWAKSGELTSGQAKDLLDRLIESLPKAGRILLAPPDITRCYSYGGAITAYLYHRLSGESTVRIMPAVGTHRAMTREEQIQFFGGDIPESAFLYHNWRRDTVEIGAVPGEYCAKVSDGRYADDIGVEVNRGVADGSYDLILSIGQVVPHEVIGMSNYTKNILVGLGGRPMINGTHMMGALCNLETIMGNTDSPVRAVFDYGEEHFLAETPLVYILTVAAQKEGGTALAGETDLMGGTTLQNKTSLLGLFAGASRAVYEHAAALARQRCITHTGRRAAKVVAYLEPEEFSSTWVGNKAIYRTRMIIEDGGELLVIAPGVKAFGENEEVDSLIRRYGYKGTPYTRKLLEQGAFPDSAMVPAHMIHSSSEGRFKITYAVNPDHLTESDILGVGYEYMDVKEALKRYPVQEMENGWQIMADGEEIYMVKAPALGLWKE